ncbi:MAG: UvrABC system protein B [Patescibacteria group bacterium]|nr:MAG: UvrABC system protein B [Patescibacteria group bacterium]
MKKFNLELTYKPTLEQKRAVEELAKGYQDGNLYQVLLGVTGSGKTFVMANLIEKLQMPALIISHNKTLAGQLYQEMREFFPKNAVSFFISYYDYYQPEAYIPSTDTYIEKDSAVNELIDKLRLETTANLLSRDDVIVVASVSCIYNLGSPKSYGNFSLKVKLGSRLSQKELIDKLIDLQYERNEFDFRRGTFRLRGDYIDIYLAYIDKGVRIYIEYDQLRNISYFDPITGNKESNEIEEVILFPAKHFIAERSDEEVFEEIKRDMEERVKFFEKKGDLLSAQRIKQKVNYDLEMIKEFGYVKGIENYSRYFDNRKPGEPPFTLLDYFTNSYKDKWLLIVDESHISFPQIRGMYNGDKSRKQTLIDYGFRLPSALDNRPLKFDEFLDKIPNFIATSATPDIWEVEYSHGKVVELLTRPTGIPDPEILIKPTKNQVADVIEEIKTQVKKKQRTLVTTLTKNMAEDLSSYLADQGLKVHYLHSEVKTLERSDILESLRKGEYDVLVGVNLLREGLDLPEVSLVAILDADKEGFLRSKTTLIQTMGRAARHVEGRVILYADVITDSIKEAIREVERRRKYQLEVNKKYNIKPKSVIKPIRSKLIEKEETGVFDQLFVKESTFGNLDKFDIDSLTPLDRKKLVKKLRQEMNLAANDLDFELAIKIRDKIREIESIK